jgi:hypothetical protein
MSGTPYMRPPCAVFQSENGAVTRRDPGATHVNYIRYGPSCAVFRSENGAVSRRDPEATHVRYARHATTVRRFPIGKRRGNPQRSGGNACKLCETWASCAVFRSENGAVSRRDPDATHVKYARHATTVRRFPIGKRRGNPQRSRGTAYELCKTWPILRRFPIGKQRGIPQRSGGNARQVRQTCDHRAPFSDRKTAR